MISPVLGEEFQRVAAPVGRRNFHARPFRLDQSEFGSIGVLQPAAVALSYDKLEVLSRLAESQCLLLNSEIPSGATRDFESIQEILVGAGVLRKLNSDRKQPILTSLPQDLVYPLPSRQGVRRPELGRPAFLEEAEQVEDIALSPHVRSDKNVQRPQGKVDISQAFEIPRAHSRNHKDTETIIPRSPPYPCVPAIIPSNISGISNTARFDCAAALPRMRA
jgi:hypothetical protein